MTFPSARALPLKLNRKPIIVSDIASLLALFFPGLSFLAGLIYLASFRSEFAWLKSPAAYPLELYLIAISGCIATLAGIGDWIYHRIYVAAGPRERRSHLLALATGGAPLFVLMSWATISSSPFELLVPILIVLLYTCVLICYDEFIFHWKRCRPLETALHRILVFGNAIAFLAWIHWCFSAKGSV